MMTAGRYMAHERGAFNSPNTILRPCATPGCPELVTRGRCAKHSTQHQQRYDTARGNSTERGYDADHRRLRLQCFIRDGWTCRECGWAPSIVQTLRDAGVPLPPVDRIVDSLRREFAAGRRHLHADHRLTVVEHPELRLELGNYQTLCSSCHNRKTASESSHA